MFWSRWREQREADDLADRTSVSEWLGTVGSGIEEREREVASRAVAASEPAAS